MIKQVKGHKAHEIESIEGASSAVKIDMYWNIDEIKEIWDNIKPDDVFMQSPYLKAMELAPPKGSAPVYALISDLNGNCIGKSYFQYKRFILEESLKLQDIDEKCPSFFNAFSDY